MLAIPPAPDGSKQGLDDLLARHGAAAFKELLQSPETRPAAGATVPLFAPVANATLAPGTGCPN